MPGVFEKESRIIPPVREPGPPAPEPEPQGPPVEDPQPTRGPAEDPRPHEPVRRDPPAEPNEPGVPLPRIDDPRAPDVPRGPAKA